MKNYLTILKLISCFLLLNINSLLAIDIIQVDVGNSINFTGILNMPATELVNPNNHGTDMAKALQSELKIQKSKPVDAKQLVWEHGPFGRSSLIQALAEAIYEHPKVLSLSYGGSRMDSLEEAILITHAVNDTVIVAAAGNQGGGREYYPANYTNSCILSVGTTIDGKKADYSNHADVWLEYNPKDPSGTSASTARMAGIVLQLRRNYPYYKCDKIVLTMRMLYGSLKK